MAEYPPIMALIVTYRRLSLAIRTIQSVKEQVRYPGQIGFHIADDGSGEEYIARLRDEIGPDYHVTATNARRGGVGRNMNMGIQACLERADMWLHLEDDWVLPIPLDLEPCVRLLEQDPTVGMVRLGCISAGVRGRVFGARNRAWWRLERGSDTYIFVGNPSLRHRRFYDTYGPYPEGLLPGETELSYCGQFSVRQGPDIVWPAWLNTREMFQHIGDGWSYNWWMGQRGKTGDETAVIFEEMDKQ